MILSLDSMKLVKDTIGLQPSHVLYQNIVDLLINNAPGITHIAISVPINNSAEFEQYGNKPSPLTPEAFTDMLLDTIHNAGYGALIRGTDCYGEGIYNFPFKPQTAQEWINEITPYLTLHKAHLKNGDLIGLFPEFEGEQNSSSGQIQAFGANVTDSWPNFFTGIISAVKTWSTENGIDLIPYTTVNASEALSGFYPEGVVQVQGGFVIDNYPPATGLTDAEWIASAKQTIDTLNTKYGPFPVFLQEIADTRAAVDGVFPQLADPGLTAEFLTQVGIPYLQSGHLLGLNLWCLFDTPQEGILTIDGDSVSLNPKGQALSQALKTAFGSVTTTPVPTPPITPTPPAANTVQVSGTMTTNGTSITLELQSH